MTSPNPAASWWGLNCSCAYSAHIWQISSAPFWVGVSPFECGGPTPLVKEYTYSIRGGGRLEPCTCCMLMFSVEVIQHWRKPSFGWHWLSYCWCEFWPAYPVGMLLLGIWSLWLSPVCDHLVCSHFSRCYTSWKSISTWHFLGWNSKLFNSTLIELVLDSQFEIYLVENNLNECKYLTYWKYHSLETTLFKVLWVWDHVIFLRRL